MFHWRHGESVPTNATAEQIWSVWRDAQHWPRWDRALQWVKMNEPFQRGAVGFAKPMQGRMVTFVLTRVEENQEFCGQARLPLATIEFSHRYERLPTGQAQIVHEVYIRGLLAPLFGWTIGRRLSANLRNAMQEVARRAVTHRA